MSSSASVSISLTAPVDVPADLAAPALEAILRRFQAEPGQAALSVDLACDLQFPVEATVNVPVRLNLAGVEGQTTFKIRLEAARQREYYPDFTGILTVRKAARSAARFDLAGTYVVPLGMFGKSLDMTLLGGAAESSLSRFLKRLAEETVRRVREEQAEHARAVMYRG